MATALLYGWTVSANADGPPAGMVAAYGFDEGVGWEVADSTGNGNEGTVFGPSWSVSGKFGGALQFDGSDDFVVVPDDDSLDLTTAMTLSAWVKLDQVDGRWQDVIFKERNGDNGSYGLDADGSGSSDDAPSLSFNDGSWRFASAAGPLDEDEWVHLAGTWDGATMKLYVDGVLAGTQSQSGTVLTSTGDLVIGGTDVFGSGQHLDGFIDEVRVYNRVLTAGEIGDDMESSVVEQVADLQTSTDDLVAAYAFDEGSGATVVDTSAETNEGTISGASWSSGRFGDALAFDGSDDFVVVPDDDSLDLTTAMTLSAWVKLDDVHGRWQDVIFKERNGDDGSYGLNADGNGLMSDTPSLSFNDGSWRFAYSNDPLVEDEWVHLAGTWDGATMKLYVNGAIVSSQAQTGTILASTGNLVIGGTDVFGGNQHVDGLIDDVRIYDRALSQAEVQYDLRVSVADQTAAFVPPHNETLPTISGEAIDGETLAATTGTWSGGGPMDYAYQWRRCDDEGENCTDISSATDATLELEPANVDHTVRVAVTAEGPGGEQEAVSAPTALVSGFTATITGTPRRNENLRAEAGTWRGAGSVLFGYQWQRCDENGDDCDDIDGARRQTYSLGMGDVGHTIRVRIGAGGESAPTRSAATAVVAEQLPSRADDPLIYGHAAVGTTVGTESGGWKPESATVSFQWRRCDAEGEDCVAIAGATERTYAVQTEDIDATLRVAVTATTSGGSVTKNSRATLPIVEPAVTNTTAPTLAIESGSYGSVAVADPGEWDAVGDVSFLYRWERCNTSGQECVAVAGASEEGRQLSADDVGFKLRVVVTASNATGRATAVSAPSVTIAVSAPTNTEEPTVSGIARAGEMLAAGVGEWTAVGDVEHEFQWQRCDAVGDGCTPITGATDGVYEVAAADVAGALRVDVTATNETGSSSAVSAVTEVVEAAGAGPSLIAAPTISGDPESGEELTVLPGVWGGAVDYTYQWERCDETGQDCEPIHGETGDDYELTDRDVGLVVQAEVAAWDADDVATFVSVATDQSIRAVGGPTNSVRPMVTGTAEEGETLTAGTGTWTTTPPASYGYRWQRCSLGVCADIESATSSSYTLTSTDAHYGIRAVVAAEDAVGETTAVSNVTAPVTAVTPHNHSLPTASGDTRVGEVLEADEGVWDGDAPIAYMYQWRRCNSAGGTCSDISDADDATYELDAADSGHAIRVVATATNGAGETDATSSASAPISDEDGPAPLSAPTITGVAFDGDELTADPGEWSPTPSSTAYQWQRCVDPPAGECAAISGATNVTYTATYADRGAALRVMVAAVDGGDMSFALSEATVVVEPEPDPEGPADRLLNTVPPSIDGTAHEGETLTADPGTWQSSSSVSYSYRWRRCDLAGRGCVSIDGASDSSYEIVSDDVGGTLRVIVTAANDQGDSAVVSDATAVVTPLEEPVNLRAPVVSGQVIDGELVTATEGLWAGVGMSLSYQWQRCDDMGEDCDDISGATDQDYMLTSDDVWGTVRVIVTATNSFGPTSQASEPTPFIEASNVVNVEPPTISGNPLDGATLAGNAGEWTGTDVALDYQWRRCDDEGENCTDIDGATDDSLELTSDDVGSTLRLAVTGENAQNQRIWDNEVSAISAASGVVVARAPYIDIEPEIYGNALQDAELEADPGEWFGTPEATFAYQWKRCDDQGENCAPISGATDQLYVVASADVGSTLRVTVTAANAGGSDTATSVATDVVAVPDPPAPGEWGPETYGEPYDARDYIADPGDWVSETPVSYSYQWLRCDNAGDNCTPISGADGGTYTTGSADLASTIRVEVTATNAGGSDSATTEASGVVSSAAVSNLSEPYVSGDGRAGAVLTAVSGSWAGSGPLTHEYQWQLCDDQGENCQDIAGEDDDTYTVRVSDIEQRIRVIETVTGAVGNDEATSSSRLIGSRPYNIGLPVVSGLRAVHQRLRVDSGDWLPEPDQYLYQWQRCSDTGQSCGNIAGATNVSYLLEPDDFDNTVRVRVVAQNDGDLSPPYVFTDATEVIGQALSGPPINDTQPLIDGDAAIGEQLHVSDGEWSGGPPWEFNYEFQWRRCNINGHACVSIPGTGSSTYEPRRADAGSTVRVQVTASNDHGSTTVTSDATAVVPAAPTLANLMPPTMLVAWAPLTYGLEYRAFDYGTWAGDPEIAHQWQRCDPLTEAPLTGEMDCTDIPDATDPDGYVPQTADVGFKLRLAETATVPGDSQTVYSDPTNNTVGFDSDDDGGAYTGPTVVAETIVADSTVETDAGLPLTTNYEFLRLHPGGATDVLQDGSSPEYEITGAELGYQIRIAMTVSKWRADEEVVLDTDLVTLNTPVVEDQPTNDVAPTIEGDTVEGVTLQADPGEWSGGGGSLQYAYAWQRCDGQGDDCVPIPDATEPYYELATEDVGATLRVDVTASNGPADGNMASGPTGVVVAADEPINVGVPTISGDLVEFATLEADPGTWSGSDPIDYSFQWQSCAADDSPDCSDIEDATTATYELTDFDVGERMRVKVTATNAAGTDTATSDATGPIEPPASPANIEAPSLSVLGPPESGSTLLADSGTWDNVADDALEYQWQRCGALGVGCEDIEDADGYSYQLGEGDSGAQFRVVVTAGNSAGEMTAISETSPLIGPSTGSADGKMAYLDASRSELYLSETDGGSPEMIADCMSLTGDSDCTLRRPRIAPNLKSIAVEDRDSETARGEGQILLVNFDGSDPRELATGSDPAWSSDGTELLFTGTDTEDPEIRHVARIAATGDADPVPVVEGNGSWETPDVSAEGELVYAGQGTEDDTPGIYIAGPEGDDGQLDQADATRLDLGPHIVQPSDPRFSADGTEIVFTATTSARSAEGTGELRSLWGIGTDGHDLRRITPDEDSTNGSGSAAGESVWVTRRKATITSFGFGISITYGSPAIWEIPRGGGGGGEPIPVADEAVDPDIARAAGPAWERYIDCRGRKRCKRWQRDERLRAQAYARQYALDPNDKFYDYSNREADLVFFRQDLPGGGGDCTNFASQVWFAAGHQRMHEFVKSYHSWWAIRSDDPNEADSTSSWRLVEAFINQQRDESRRARALGSLHYKRWKLGDVIAFNLDPDPEYDHLAIVTRIGRRAALSYHSKHHKDRLWSEMARSLSQKNQTWTYFVLRPRFKAANIPQHLRRDDD